MSKAFVVSENQKYSYADLQSFCQEMVPVFRPNSQVTLHPQGALGHARNVLRNITAEDYLVLVGDPVIIGICFAVVAELLGRVRVLKWDKFSMRYVPIEIDFLDRVGLN